MVHEGGGGTIDVQNDMAIALQRITEAAALELLSRAESHFWDFKSMQVAPGKLQKAVVALLNADGGELVVGIEDPRYGTALNDRWKGFTDQEPPMHMCSLCLKT